MESPQQRFFRLMSPEQLERWMADAGPKHQYYHVALRESERRQKAKDEEKANPPPTMEILRQQDEFRSIMKATDEPEQLAALTPTQLRDYRKALIRLRPRLLQISAEVACGHRIDDLQREIDSRKSNRRFWIAIAVTASLGIAAMIQRYLDRPISKPTPSPAGTPLPTFQIPQTTLLPTTPVPTPTWGPANLGAIPTSQATQSPPLSPTPAR